MRTRFGSVSRLRGASIASASCSQHDGQAPQAELAAPNRPYPRVDIVYFAAPGRPSRPSTAAATAQPAKGEACIAVLAEHVRDRPSRSRVTRLMRLSPSVYSNLCGCLRVCIADLCCCLRVCIATNPDNQDSKEIHENRVYHSKTQDIHGMLGYNSLYTLFS